MTDTITDRATERTADHGASSTPRLWITSAVSPYGNPYGHIAVIAETRDEAIAKVRRELETAKGGYVPADRYAKNVVDNLEQQMIEIPSGLFIDWQVAEKRR